MKIKKEKFERKNEKIYKRNVMYKGGVQVLEIKYLKRGDMRIEVEPKDIDLHMWMSKISEDEVKEIEKENKKHRRRIMLSELKPPCFAEFIRKSMVDKEKLFIKEEKKKDEDFMPKLEKEG